MAKRSGQVEKVRPSVALSIEAKQIVEKIAAEHRISDSEVMSRLIEWMTARSEAAWSLVLTPLPEEFVPRAVERFAQEIIDARGIENCLVAVQCGAEEASRESTPDAKAKPSGGRPSPRRETA
jgi:hypothetical protein